MYRAELCNRADDVHTYPWGCARSYHTKNAWKPWKTINNPLAERPRVRWRQRVHFHHRRLTTRGDATIVADRRVRTAILPRRAALTSGTGVIVFTFTGSRARLGPRSTQVPILSRYRVSACTPVTYPGTGIVMLSRTYPCAPTASIANRYCATRKVFQMFSERFKDIVF